jgi:transcriptional regulator with XRE-family HTH domain
MDLSRRLRERGLSQADLARAVGVSPQAVSFWTTGQKQPSSQFEEKIREFLESRPIQEAGRREGSPRQPERDQAFINQCALMLTGAGLEVEDAERAFGSRFLIRHADLVATSRKGERYIVECKPAPSVHKTRTRLQDVVARLLLAEVAGDEEDTHFVLLTDRQLLPPLQAAVDRLRAIRPAFHVIALDEVDAADRLRALAK